MCTWDGFAKHELGLVRTCDNSQRLLPWNRMCFLNDNNNSDTGFRWWIVHMFQDTNKNWDFHLIYVNYLAPHRGRARYCNAHVCLFVCLCVCPCFRKISKCNISAISKPIIMKLGIHITYGYTVTDKYFQNFRSKVKVVGRRKVKNVIWPYLGNEWS